MAAAQFLGMQQRFDKDLKSCIFRLLYVEFDETDV